MICCSMAFKTIILSCLLVLCVTKTSYIIDDNDKETIHNIVLRFTNQESTGVPDSTYKDLTSSDLSTIDDTTGDDTTGDDTTGDDTTGDDTTGDDTTGDDTTGDDTTGVETTGGETSNYKDSNDDTQDGNELSAKTDSEKISGADNSDDTDQTNDNNDKIDTPTVAEKTSGVDADTAGDTSADSSGNGTKSEDDRIKEACTSVGLTNCTVDDHKYYKAVYVPDNSSWIELCPEEGSVLNSTRHANLSAATAKRGYRTNAHLSMSSYIFYGLPVDNVTILTGGFLHVGPLFHSQIVTQANYISPFMGNFNPNQSEESNLYYYSDDTMFIVQWDKMQLNDSAEKGSFTFQVQLHSNNDIVFAYKELPIVNLPAEQHENSVGVCDAFHVTAQNNVVINVYHDVQVNKSRIASNTAVKLVHQQLCMMFDNCYDCTTNTLQDFECRWCSKLKKCADREGDRDLQPWLEAGCTVNHKKQGQKCDEYCYFPSSTVNTQYSPTYDSLRPFIDADPSGNSTVRIKCENHFSVSANFKLSAADVYQCTSGAIDVPSCQKSCNYTTTPVNGKLQGVAIGHLLRPDSSFSVYCNPGHRLRSQVIKQVTCIDDGIMVPDPANIRCEKFCSLPHQQYTFYMPEPTTQGILHEGESTNMMCSRNYILEDYASGEFPNSTIIMTCSEDTDLTILVRKCVGYCTFLTTHPNTTYSPDIPRIGDKINITCANGTNVNENSQKEYTCAEPGVLDLPVCQYIPVKSKVTSSTANSLRILLAIFICTIACVIGSWVLYAYRHPTSPSGLFLIEKCRPWTWRSQSRYSRHHESLADSYYMDGGI